MMKKNKQITIKIKPKNPLTALVLFKSGSGKHNKLEKKLKKIEKKLELL